MVDQVFKTLIAIAILASSIAIVQPRTAVGATGDTRSLIVIADSRSSEGPVVRQAGTIDETQSGVQFVFGTIQDWVNLTLRLPDGQPFTPGT